MKRGPMARFLLRWFVCSLGLWIAAGILGQRINYGSHVGVIIIAGLILAVVNVIINSKLGKTLGPNP